VDRLVLIREVLADGVVQCVVSELLEAFRAGDGAELILQSVRLVMRELIKTESG